MEETKKGVILFHEVLKDLKIPHTIIGFWEEATEVKDNYKPNYAHVIHSFSDSLYQHHGAKIMQLEAQEDNRDGFSIRTAAAELEARNEKNRFLLVFSDGQPAASDYTDNGIIDTTKAVFETRRKNIDVIGMFLAEGDISEQDDTLMRNIYGRERIMVPTATQLPEHFSPLLKNCSSKPSKKGGGTRGRLLVPVAAAKCEMSDRAERPLPCPSGHPDRAPPIRENG